MTKLCRAAKHFQAKASLELSSLRSQGYALYRDGDNTAEINHQIDELQHVIDGLSTLIWTLGVTNVIPCRERTAQKYRTVLIRHLADLYLDELSEAAAANLYAARTYLKDQRQPVLSIFESAPELETVS